MPRLPAYAPEPAVSRSLTLPRWLTVEVALLGGVLCLAGGLRFLALGDGVLSAEESRRALAAWHIVHGEGAELVHGPALLFPSALLLFLFGANDTVVRLFPALAGMFVVVWPYLVRRELGRGSALLASLLLAISPSLVLVSRSQSGESVALALLLLAALGWLRYRKEGSPSWLAVASVSAGLTLAAGPSAFALVVPAGIALAAFWFFARGSLADWMPDGKAWRRGAIWGGVAAALLATGLLTRVGGLQTGIIDAGAAWVSSLVVGRPEWPAFSYGTGLVAYEPAALFLGLAGLLVARRGRLFLGFLVVWAAVALLAYSLAATKDPGSLAFVAFPLALAAGRGIVDIWEAHGERLGLAGVGLFLASTIPIVALWGTIATNVSRPGTTLSPLLLAIPPCMFGVVAGYWVHARGPRRVSAGLLCLIAILLLGAELHASSSLAFASETQPAELLVGRAFTRDVRNLVDEIGDHAAVYSTAGRRDIAVLVDERLRYPLGWYLRDYSRVTYGAKADAPLLVVTMPDRDPPAGSYGYKQYLWAVSHPPALDTPGRVWRWLVYRESGGPAFRENVRLYVALKPSG